MIRLGAPVVLQPHVDHSAELGSAGPIKLTWLSCAPVRRRIVHASASRISPLEAFDVPVSRSLKTIGTSTTGIAFRTHRNTNSISNAKPCEKRSSGPTSAKQGAEEQR